jgi:hypothetical protein
VDVTVQLRASQNADNYLLAGKILAFFSSDSSGLIELCKHTGPPDNKKQCSEKTAEYQCKKSVGIWRSVVLSQRLSGGSSIQHRS